MSDTKMIDTRIINDINRLHSLASNTALDAIDYANQAGLLLLEIRRSLPHGQFSLWVDSNLSVSLRQCQRYMEVATGKEIAIRELTDTSDAMSRVDNFLTEEELQKIINETWTPEWRPQAGYWYFTTNVEGSFWVVPDLQVPERFHVSRLYDDPKYPSKNLFDGTRWPEPAAFVELRLRIFGLPNPSTAKWIQRQKEGLTEPFGAPKGYGCLTVKRADGSSKVLRDAH